MEFIRDKKVLIIGGSGTIGKALIKKILSNNPSVIRIYSRDEFKLFNVQNEYINTAEFNKLRFLIGDVRDYQRLERAMDEIDIVFNLAAMKHVHICEYNPEEAIKTNVMGMQNVIKAALKKDVESVLFTSSDKAINPTNTYGATKMLAEKLVQAANFSKGSSRTKFIAVRFGNVMGSRGSVIPLFKKQIINEKIVTITDPKMNRFMMSLNQAIDLMLESCKISVGGELFVLKMPVVNLGDLSDVVVEEVCKKNKIRESDISRKIIGARAGERNDEILMTKDEANFAKDLGNMYVVFPTGFNNDIYIEKYMKYDKCKLEDYSSGSLKAVNKNKIRIMLEEDNLI